MYHHFLQQNLQNFLQVMQNLDLWLIEKQRGALNLQNDSITVFKIFLKHYCKRFAHQKHLTLLIAAQKYMWINKTQNFRSWCDHLKMINLFSRYSDQSSHVDYSNFCKDKLMLHHCFQSVILDDLLNDDDENWMSAYVACAINHDHLRDSLRIMLKMIETDSEIKSLKHNEIEQNQNLRHEELLSQCRSNHANSFMQIFIDLSKRFMNKNHDWLQSTCDVTLIIIWDHSIVACIIRKNAFASVILEKIDSLFLLNVKQQDVVDWIIDYYHYCSDAQLLLHLNKIVEIEKSICINLIFSHLTYYAAQINMSNSILQAIFIDVTVFNIKSFILHQLLNLLIQSVFKFLKLKSLTRLQNCFRRCCFLIIDKKFMIDLKTLHYIDQRFRQIYTWSNVFFKDFFILFCNDFDQLSSISDQALYNSYVTSFFIKTLTDLQTYFAFDQIVVLSQIMKQQDENAES